MMDCLEGAEGTGIGGAMTRVLYGDVARQRNDRQETQGTRWPLLGADGSVMSTFRQLSNRD